ncbi:iron-containing redox enzyme family protein [Streptomyces sp. NBC_01498]|uniref:iron-containing redox enzyme family protein n=1 Tax=Streptomyces sp. NBC_01498 TaxID=2975870 RepID=UPI002E7BF844|nr:iron-containing redox enzyme family protein [Streptomyces sp. NBC_01498]WTL28485.1 iron-containing redox enzyme family protein [Streptomyces sp. NBC_01498]
MENADVRPTGPTLPTGRGDLSYGVVRALRGRPGSGTPLPARTAADDAAPYGEDLHLALYLCYELHYRGFCGVDPAWEWDPALLAFRATLERHFLDALRADTKRRADVDEALADLLVEPPDGTSVSHYLRDEGELWHLREYAAQRSVQHLKEADPYAWVIPRLRGRAKAAMAAVEFAEFGAGHAGRSRSRLYADLMTDLGLDAAYGRYVEVTTGEMLASVNLMSMFGLHRALRGALVGHRAAVEAVSVPAARRLAEAMRGAGAGGAAVRFYGAYAPDDTPSGEGTHDPAGHLTADPALVRREVVGGLLDDEPWLETDVAFGVDATGVLDARLAERLLTAWRDGLSGLRSSR